MFDIDLAALIEAARSALAALSGLPAEVLARVPVTDRLAAVSGTEPLTTLACLAQARLVGSFDVADPTLRMAVDEMTGARVPRPCIPGPAAVSPHELSAALGCTVEFAADRWATAQVLATLPRTVGAARGGDLAWWQVRRVADRVTDLPDGPRAEVDRRIAADAVAGRCRGRFGPRLSRAVLAARPRRPSRRTRVRWPSAARPSGRWTTAWPGSVPASVLRTR